LAFLLEKAREKLKGAAEKGGLAKDKEGFSL